MMRLCNRASDRRCERGEGNRRDGSVESSPAIVATATDGGDDDGRFAIV